MNYFLTLPPGAAQGIDAVGDYLSVSFATADLMIRMNLENNENREEAVFAQGDSVELKTNRFKRIQVRNPSAFVTLHVTLYVGNDRYNQRRQSTMETPTEIAGVPLAAQQIPAGATITLTGIPTGAQIRRKSVIVSNVDPANSLIVQDKDSVPCAVAFANQSVMLPLSEAVKIVNITANPIVCYISEIWYIAK